MKIQIQMMPRNHRILRHLISELTTGRSLSQIDLAQATSDGIHVGVKLDHILATTASPEQQAVARVLKTREIWGRVPNDISRVDDPSVQDHVFPEPLLEVLTTRPGGAEVDAVDFHVFQLIGSVFGQPERSHSGLGSTKRVASKHDIVQVRVSPLQVHN